jgi:hypothetical protein
MVLNVFKITKIIKIISFLSILFVFTFFFYLKISYSCSSCRYLSKYKLDGHKINKKCCYVLTFADYIGYLNFFDKIVFSFDNIMNSAK